MALEVRALEAADAMRAGIVLRRAYRQIYPDGNTYIDEVADVERRLSLALVLGCFLDGRLGGCATLVLDERSTFAEELLHGEAGLRMLGVDPDLQHHGIGWLLVGACARRARSADRHALVLHTDTKMVAAQHLYERAGFVRTPERDLTLPEVTLLCYRLDLDGRS